MAKAATSSKGRKLTKKQKVFADAYLETGNGTQSALKAYNIGGKRGKGDKAKIASVVAVENLSKPRVQEYLESKAERAAERIVELSEQEEVLPVALGASKDILDRSGFAPVAKTQSVHLHISLSPEEKEKITSVLSKVRSEMTHEEING